MTHEESAVAVDAAGDAAARALGMGDFHGRAGGTHGKLLPPVRTTAECPARTRRTQVPIRARVAPRTTEGSTGRPNSSSSEVARELISGGHAAGPTLTPTPTMTCDSALPSVWASARMPASFLAPAHRARRGHDQIVGPLDHHRQARRGMKPLRHRHAGRQCQGMDPISRGALVRVEHRRDIQARARRRVPAGVHRVRAPPSADRR